MSNKKHLHEHERQLAGLLEYIEQTDLKDLEMVRFELRIPKELKKYLEEYSDFLSNTVQGFDGYKATASKLVIFALLKELNLFVHKDRIIPKEYSTKAKYDTMQYIVANKDDVLNVAKLKRKENVTEPKRLKKYQVDAIDKRKASKK